MRTFIAAAAAVLITSIAPAHDRFVLQYHIEKLEGVAGTPSHINNLGAVSGYGFGAAGASISFLWTRRRLTDLGTDSAFAPINAVSVNDRSEVVGDAVVREADGTAHTQGYIWSHAHFEAIGALPGDGGFSSATDINNRGQIVGYADSSNGTECVLWEDGTLMALPGFPLPGDCVAMAINDHGAVTGADGGGPHAQPFVWREGVFRQLPIPTDGVRGATSDINNLGVIVGSYARADNTSEGLVWRGGRYLVLAPPSPYLSAFPLAINDFGVMAGTALLDTAGNEVAVIWVKGHMLDLSTLIVPDDPLKACAILREAQSINNAGEIAVLGSDSCATPSSTVFRLVPGERDRHHQ